MSKKQFKQKPQYVKAEKVKKEPSITGRRLLASLFNNQAAFDGGRFEAAWLAILLFLAAIMISLIPGMVLVSKTSGSDNLAGNLYHTDIGMVRFSEKLVSEQVDLVIREENGKTVFKNEELAFAEKIATASYTLSDGLHSEAVPYFSFSQPRETSVVGEDGTITTEMKPFEYLRVYYTGEVGQTFIVGGNVYQADRYLGYKLGTLKSEGATENVTSHIIIGREAVYSRIYNPATIYDKNQLGLTFEGRTSSLPVGMSVKSFATKSFSDNSAINSSQVDYVAKVVANFANMQNLAYKEVKVQTFWLQTGVYAGIFTLIGLVMGLIIFISTRGKNNPHRNVKFGEAMKIGAWLLPTPALFTLIAGFLFPTYFHMVFIMSLGIRSVWLTMRTLGPQQQA